MSEAPRVAVFCEQGHPDSDFTSGVSRFTRTLFDYARRTGWTLDVFLYHDEEEVTRRGSVTFHAVEPRTPVEFHGLEVDPWDIVPLRNRKLTDPALKGSYDVVFATAPGVGTQAQLVAGKLGLPLAMLVTTNLPNYAAELLESVGRSIPGLDLLKGPAREMAWQYLQWLYSPERTDLLLVPTEAVKEEWGKRVSTPIRVLGRGADTLSFDEPADLAHHEGPPRILYVGRLDVGQKNLMALVRAVREIPEAHLVLVGGGAHRERLEDELAPEMEAGRVTFTGYVSDREELARLYQSADLFGFPSLFDTLGQVVVEAQRAGLPVVVRDQGGPPELVEDGESGFVTGSDDAFVARCRELVRDRELRVRMGAAAWERGRSFPTWDEIMERLRERLAELGRRDRRG